MTSEMKTLEDLARKYAHPLPDPEEPYFMLSLANLRCLIKEVVGEPVGVFADVNSLTPEQGTRWEHMVPESFDGVKYIHLHELKVTL